MANPIQDATCSIDARNRRVISWTLSRDMGPYNGFELHMENSRAGGPWEVISEDLLNECFFIDDRRRNWNKRMDEHYRLWLHKGAEEYRSGIIHAGVQYAWPFDTEAKNAITQIQGQIAMSGVAGVLLKERKWGSRCVHCTDFDGQESVNEHCPHCSGTGVEGGYYPGISLALVKDGISKSERRGQLGRGQVEAFQGRCIAYPWIHVGDVWVEDGTNKRFVINELTPTSTYKTADLVYAIKADRAEYADQVYAPGNSYKVEVKDVWVNAESERLYNEQMQKDMDGVHGERADARLAEMEPRARKSAWERLEDTF